MLYASTLIALEEPHSTHNPQLWIVLSKDKLRQSFLHRAHLGALMVTAEMIASEGKAEFLKIL